MSVAEWEHIVALIMEHGEHREYRSYVRGYVYHGKERTLVYIPSQHEFVVHEFLRDFEGKEDWTPVSIMEMISHVNLYGKAFSYEELLKEFDLEEPETPENDAKEWLRLYD